MHVTFARFRFKTSPESGDLKRRVEGFVEEVLAPAPGFREYYAVAVSEIEAFSVAVWETREDFERARDRVVAVTQQIVGADLAGLPERASGEVIVHRRA